MTRTTSHESRAPSSGGRPLAGKGVVITRPAHQAQELARLIEGAGGRPLVFPAIEIREVEDPAPFLALVDRLDEFDLAIFISPNAAQRALPAIHARRSLPAGLRVAAVGGGTARTLEGFGVTGVIVPVGRYDSEALLELPAVASAKRVVIFRGQGGRELLGDALAKAGATVAYAECYRRVRPAADGSVLLAAWDRDEIAAVVATSSEGLRNFVDMIGKAGRERCSRTPLFVPHPRIAQSARELGMGVVVATGPGDEGLLAGLTAYFQAAR